MDKEEREFLSLLQEKRHKEMIGMLAKISESLGKKQPSEELEKMIASIPTTNDMSQGAIAISKLIIKELKDIKDVVGKKKKEKGKWLFKMNKDMMGEVESVTVTEK